MLSNLSFTGTQNLWYERDSKKFKILHIASANIGDYKQSARTNDFKGWLLCNGRSVLISDYPDLFDVISDSFGSEGEGYFNIPNCAGKVFANIHPENEHYLGEVIGTEDTTLSVDQLPSHNHTGTTSSNSTGLTADGTTASHNTGLTADGTTASSTANISVNSVADHTHTYQDAYFAEAGGSGSSSLFGTNGNTDTDNNFRWRTAGGGWSTTPSDLTTGTGGAHTHSITDSTHTHNFSCSIHDPGHVHTFSCSIHDPQHQHTFTTSTIGSGNTLSLFQPTVFAGNMFIFAKYI